MKRYQRKLLETEKGVSHVRFFTFINFFQPPRRMVESNALDSVLEKRFVERVFRRAKSRICSEAKRITLGNI